MNCLLFISNPCLGVEDFYLFLKFEVGEARSQSEEGSWLSWFLGL